MPTSNEIKRADTSKIFEDLLGHFSEEFALESFQQLSKKGIETQVIKK